MKLLVANRSEIACRIFQACREMGISTVAIFAPGDEEARHLTYADEVAAVSSYLNVDEIVSVAQKLSVGLIHPGYGFLSERPIFARAVEAAGIGFVGPRAETMEALGGKIDAKELATRAGVPTLPWAKVAQGQSVVEAAKKVGFPLLLKAAAGGGGKGMRRVNRWEEVEAAAESASAEAISAFGDGALFLEKLVDRPRHIEVQVFGDGLGGVVHLFERECSLQRRHQKVWEEATAPHLSETTRKGLLDAAVRLSQSVKYRSAGTLEFLVDEAGGFYFLEMNTRLQVEHPVTELVTGVDLVHAQIRQALHPKSSHLPQVAAPRGHAIEVRLYAEDPALGFVPTPGKVERLRWPTGPGIRVDSGIEEGQTVGTGFDSMLAKVIVYAENREMAIERMKFALEESVVLGLGTNQVYLRSLCDEPSVRAGRVYTNFLDQEFASQFHPQPTEQELELIGQCSSCGISGSAHEVGIMESGAMSLLSPWGGISKAGFRP